MERRDGILQMTFHTGGGPLQWGLLPHGEFPQRFRDVGSDPENKVIITGTGDVYSGPRAAGGTGMRTTPAQWDRVYWEGKRLLMSLLDIGLESGPLLPAVLDAAKALELGMVNELRPRPALLPRAWALAGQLGRQPSLLLGYTRALSTQPLKRQLIDYLRYGLTLEGMSVVARTLTPGA